MKTLNIALSIALWTLLSAGQAAAQSRDSISDDLPAYKLYDASGSPLTFDEFSAQSLEHRVVLFGEFHNDPMVHWLQRNLVEAAAIDGVKTALGLEMLERDDQVIWNEYLLGLFEYNRLESEAKLWNNHKTDYHPIIELAHEKGMKIIATNAPRRYATMAVKHSLDSIHQVDEQGGNHLPPLPMEIPKSDSGYVMMQAMAGPHGGMSDGMIRAQALKDYCMAYSIAMALEENERVIHLNGDFHSRYRDGIGSYLELLDDAIDFVVVAVVYSDDRMLALPANAVGLGDFLVVLPSSMTKTH